MIYRIRCQFVHQRRHINLLVQKHNALSALEFTYSPKKNRRGGKLGIFARVRTSTYFQVIKIVMSLLAIGLTLFA